MSLAPPVNLPPSAAPRHLLLISPNWLGDVVMALPAYQAWRAAHPGAAVTVLAKPAVAPLWSLCAGVHSLVTLEPGLGGTRRAIAALRAAGCDAAVLLPNSFRAAWIAWRAAIPCRRGTARQVRGWLLTECVSLAGLARSHQACENYRIFGLEMPATIPAPRLAIPEAEIDAARALAGLNSGHLYVALLPGAARGDSKRWPAEHFAEAARRVAAAWPDLRLLVCGAPAEREVCRQVAESLGGLALDLGGRTTLVQLAALLSQCRAVCCNDSGGMHLAAAVGVPVVAIFGLTDPAKTGPLGRRHRIVAPAGARPARAIARRSNAAARALAAIPPERATEALMEALES